MNWISKIRDRHEVSRPSSSRRDEAGAVLILALVFLVAVGGVVGSLATWASNDLNNTTQFTTARTQQYSVSGATQTAIQAIRYTPLLSTTTNASPPVACWGTGSLSEVTSNNLTVAVWCSTFATPLSAISRTVTFDACVVTAAQSGLSATALATSCASSPKLKAIVTFGDYPPGFSAPNAGQCAVYCGTTMTITSWVWG
jgi:hypothetical protein